MTGYREQTQEEKMAAHRAAEDTRKLWQRRYEELEAKLARYGSTLLMIDRMIQRSPSPAITDILGITGIDELFKEQRQAHGDHAEALREKIERLESRAEDSDREVEIMHDRIARARDFAHAARRQAIDLRRNLEKLEGVA